MLNAVRRARAARWSSSRALAALVLLPGALGCAEIASQVTGQMLGACLELSARVACASLCDDDPDDDQAPLDGDEVARPPPAEPPPPEWRPAVADCEVKSDASGVFVDCAGGTRAAFLAGTELVASAPADPRAPTVRGPVEIRSPGDVGRLAGTRAIEGSLMISSPTLTSLTAPELQSVGGDLVVIRAAALETLVLPALARVSGAVVITDNPRLPEREAEEIVFRLTRHGFSGAVDVAGNAPP